MPSAIWSGSVGFGLVQVPVRIVTATRSRDVSFNQLEEGTHSRIRYRKVSDQTGDEVPPDRIIRGYEISKGQYVVVEPEEIESLQPKAGHTIDIDQFIDLDQIDPVYFEQPYYLQPDEKGIKAYKLLVDVMTTERKVAIGKVVMRSKERLVAIRPIDGVLCLETMRYADEVLDRDSIVPDDTAEPTEKERLMARQLVESLAVEKFDIDEFHDTYREELLDLIERKAAGENIVVAAHRRAARARCSTSLPRSRRASPRRTTTSRTTTSRATTATTARPRKTPSRSAAARPPRAETAQRMIWTVLPFFHSRSTRKWPFERAVVLVAEAHQRAGFPRRRLQPLHRSHPFAHTLSGEVLRSHQAFAEQPAHVVGRTTDRSCGTRGVLLGERDALRVVVGDRVDVLPACVAVAPVGAGVAEHQ